MADETGLFRPRLERLAGGIADKADQLAIDRIEPLVANLTDRRLHVPTACRFPSELTSSRYVIWIRRSRNVSPRHINDLR